MHAFVSGRRLAFLAPAVAVGVAVVGPFAAAAQTGSAATNGVGVARISLIAGNVSLQRGDASDSLAAAINAPVLGGDYLSTGNAARTEIQFDGASQLRLGADTQLRFTHLDAGDRAVQLAQGTVELRLSRDTDGTNEIDTPSVSIKPLAQGAYRVSVLPDGKTLVTVRSGQAEIETPHDAQTLSPGSTLIAQGAAADPSIQTIAAVGSDAFDAFNADRDRMYERAQSQTAFVNTDISGVADLPTYGRWVNDGSYGNVWVPAAVQSDWAPYRDGRWVWEDGYGWTWVAAEPWGWAPYHYGSWYHSPSYGWCWYPPQPHVYTAWRPALVAFIGFGAGAGLSLGFGGGEEYNNIGWVPLAPHEAYHPWWGNRYGYGGNTTIVNNVTNITNVTNVNVYRNVRYNAVSGVTSQRFLQGNFNRNVQVGANELQHARVFRSALPIMPTASNLRFTNTAAHSPVAVRPALMQRSFAGNADVVRRTSFADQRVALANVTHAPVTPLNFRDARTTPLIRQPAMVTRPTIVPANGITARGYVRGIRRPNDVRINPAPAAAAAAVHPATPGTPAIPAYARPVHGADASDPWARFNQSRTLSTEPRHPVAAPVSGAYRQPVPSSNRVPTIDGSTYVPANETPVRRAAPVIPYHAPAADGSYQQTTTNRVGAPGNVYRPPASPSAGRPPEPGNTYRQPGLPHSYQDTTVIRRAPAEPATVIRPAPAEPATVVHPAPAEHVRAQPPASKPEPRADHPPHERR